MRVSVSICILAVTLLTAVGCGGSDTLGPDALLAGAQVELKRGDSTAAVEHAEAGLKALRQQHAQAQKIAIADTICADAHLAAGKTEQGMNHMRAALAAAENLYIARKIADTVKIGEALVRIGNQHKLEHPQMVPILVLYGNALYGNKMYLDARSAWEQAIDGGPQRADASREKFAQAIFSLASLYEDRSQSEQAQALYKNAVNWCSQDPQLIKALVAGADYHMTLEKFACKQLLMAILPVVEKDPSTPKEITNELLRKVGIIATAAEEYDAAIPITKKLLSIYEKDPSTPPKELRGVLENLCQSEYRSGHFAEAKQHYLRLAHLCRAASPPDIMGAESHENAAKMADMQMAAARETKKKTNAK
jgi:tetratricopeptide (TPR) repeat protein